MAAHEPVWCLTSKLPIRDASGAVTGLIGFSQDVRTPLNSNEIPPAFATAIGEHEQDPSAPMTPLLLARKSGMSRQRLARLTKRVFGLTPSQLITKTRLSAASRLLRETKRSVADIALACAIPTKAPSPVPSAPPPAKLRWNIADYVQRADPRPHFIASPL